MRCVHGAGRRPADALLPDARRRCTRPRGHDRRGARDPRRDAPGAAGVPRVPRAAVRLLHAGLPHHGGRVRRRQPGADGGRGAGGGRAATCAAAPATRTSSRPCCALPRSPASAPRAGRHDDQAVRRAGPAGRGRQAGHRQRPLPRRPRARRVRCRLRAQPARPRPRRRHRRECRARRRGARRGLHLRRPAGRRRDRGQLRLARPPAAHPAPVAARTAHRLRRWRATRCTTSARPS